MADIVRLDDYRTPAPRDGGRARSADAAPRPTAPPAAERLAPSPRPSAPEPLWREALGERLRAHRRDQGATLTRVADRAGISPQYLSEMERGLKEPSSEMIAAVAGALGLSLPGLIGDVARQLAAMPAPSSARDPQLRAA